VKGVNLKKINKIKSPGGSLSFFQYGDDFDFELKRIYYIYEFSELNRRGFHAHKKLKQIMFCPHGMVEVELNDGIKKEKYLLDCPEKILVLDIGYWREFVSLEENSILCVGASDIYDEDDYIRDYDQYIKWRNI
jgi:dTDP-4-dehydrorhamnose 3,5-epimerase-like enzyme